jgi:hypothetical protein
VKGEQIEVSIDGDARGAARHQPEDDEADPNGLNLQTPAVAVRAGPHRVAAAFLQRFEGPVDDLMSPIDHTLADTQIGSGFGITTRRTCATSSIAGPYKVTGISDTPSRRRIFTCRPTAPADENAPAPRRSCAPRHQAYRGRSRADVDRA